MSGICNINHSMANSINLPCTRIWKLWKEWYLTIPSEFVILSILVRLQQPFFFWIFGNSTCNVIRIVNCESASGNVCIKTSKSLISLWKDAHSRKARNSLAHEPYRSPCQVYAEPWCPHKSEIHAWQRAEIHLYSCLFKTLNLGSQSEEWAINYALAAVPLAEFDWTFHRQIAFSIILFSNARILTRSIEPINMWRIEEA